MYGYSIAFTSKPNVQGSLLYFSFFPQNVCFNVNVNVCYNVNVNVNVWYTFEVLFGK